MNEHIEVTIWKLGYNVPGGNWLIDFVVNRDNETFGSTERIRRWCEENDHFFKGNGTYFVAVTKKNGRGDLEKGSCQATIVNINRNKVSVESGSIENLTEVRS